MKLHFSALLASVAVVLPGVSARAQTAPVAVDSPFPAVSARALNAPAPVTLSAYRGKNVVVLVFLAARCNPSWEVAPRLAKLLTAYKNKPIAFFGVHANVEETNGELMAKLKAHRLPLTVLDDKPMQTLADLAGAVTTPTFVVLDKNGVLRYRGGLDKFRHPETTYLAPALDAVLAEKSVKVKQTRVLGCDITRRVKPSLTAGQSAIIR